MEHTTGGATATEEQEKADIAAAIERWASAFAADSPDEILALYSKDAVLWGTFSPTLRDNPDAIRAYFEPLFSLESRKVALGEPLIRIYGQTAVSTGSYAFSWRNGSHVETTRARYSFTYVKRDERWMIVDHHSSVVPSPGGG